MPRKFQRYVPKGYSKKGHEAKKRHVLSEADFFVDSGIQTDPQSLSPTNSTWYPKSTGVRQIDT